MDRATVSDNWNPIYTSIQKISKEVDSVGKDVAVKSSLLSAILETNKVISYIDLDAARRRQVLAKAKEHYKAREITKHDQLKAVLADSNIQNIGQFHTKREIVAIQNTLSGIHHAYIEKTQTLDELQPLIARVKENLEAFKTHIKTRIETHNMDFIVENLSSDEEKSHEELEATSKFDNLSDAMKEATKRISEMQRTQDVDKTSSRDIMHMSEIIQKNARDLARMEVAVKNGLFDDKEFTAVRGPIITDTRLDENRLKSSNVDFDTVYFPGINLGTGFQQKEAVPRMYILRDQILVGIKVNSGKPKFQLKLGKQKKADDTSSFDELRNDIISLLSDKLHTTLIDVTKERKPNYINSAKFPGIRFIWLIKKSTYDRVSAFNAGYKVSLPF